MTESEMLPVIKTYNNYLDRMQETIKHLCLNFEENSLQEFKLVLPAVVEGLAWLNEAVINFVRVGKIAEDQYRTFQQLMADITEALANKDYILLHDLFEYELKALLTALKIPIAPITN